MKLERLKNLFSIVKVIKSKYDTSKELDFNIFTVLRKEHDEVNLHSQFIVELLSNIPHYSNIFLKLFLEEIGQVDFYDLKIKVLKEYKNIDILLKNGADALIIENKIYAEDQGEQLDRYYKEMKTNNNKVKIFYLTLDGHNPSEQSLGDTLSLEGKEAVTNISYKRNISKWIEECIKESSRVPTLRETLIQYLEVVNKLTGNTINKDYQSEVSEHLMKSSKNMLLARDIIQGYNQAIHTLKLNFWKDLEKKLDISLGDLSLSQKYSIEKQEKYSKEKIQNNKKYESLIYKIKKLDEDHELTLNFEVDHRLYFGYGIFEKGERKDICNDNKFSETRELIINEINSYKKPLEFFSKNISGWWLAYIYSTPTINYRFPDENFINLTNKENMNKLIQNLVTTSFDITEAILKKINNN